MQIILIRSVLFIFRIVPERLAVDIGQGLALFWFYIIRYRRALVIENLKQAFKNEKSDCEITAIAKENFRHYGRYFSEFLKLPTWSDETIKGKVSISGFENMEAALAQKKGAIIICGHYGNFDLVNVAQAIMGIKCNVITKKAENQSVDRFWQGIREAKGVKFLPSKKSIFSILKALKRNELVALIFDQHAVGKEGVRVNFFDRPASTMRAVALIARKIKCPVVPIFNHRENGVEVVSIGKEISLIEIDDDEESIRVNTQNYNDILESFIRKHPEQWLWIHRRWK